MAMSFALAGLLQPGVRINNPSCVEKTYPEFFNELSRAVGDK
jgi:3-phosphoshikimate 1-carboxyvinyltransferase